MKKFMQLLLASFGILALAFAGCNTAVDSDDEMMDDEVMEDEAMDDDSMVEADADADVEADAMMEETAQ